MDLAVARRIPFEDPEILKYVRIAYVVSQIIVLSVYYYVSTAVSFYPIVTASSLTYYRLSVRMTKPCSNTVRFLYLCLHRSTNASDQWNLLHPWYVVLYPLLFFR